MSKSKVETKVKKHLSEIMAIEGGWDLALDIIYRRGIVRVLRETRISQGLSQEDLAKRLGITQASVAQFETERFPDFRMTTISSYAHALGLEWDISVRPKISIQIPEKEHFDG